MKHLSVPSDQSCEFINVESIRYPSNVDHECSPFGDDGVPDNKLAFP